MTDIVTLTSSTWKERDGTSIPGVRIHINGRLTFVPDTAAYLVAMKLAEHLERKKKGQNR